MTTELRASHATLVALENGPADTEGRSDPLMALADAEVSIGFAGAFVLVTARYSGGVAKHTFKAYWDGSWMKSNPPGIMIVLQHDSNGDSGKAIVEETLQINIGDPFKINQDF